MRNEKRITNKKINISIPKWYFKNLSATYLVLLIEKLKISFEK